MKGKVTEMTAHQWTMLTVIGLAACWGAVALTWLAAAIFWEPQAPAERSRVAWAGTSAGLLIVLAVDFSVPRAGLDSLAVHAPWVRLPGLAILVAAAAFTVWARLALGVMWSASPTVKQDHKLRTGGPYAVTRHPIYTGMLSMLLGTTLLAGAGRWIVAFPVFLVLVEIKLHVEERLMLAEFPDDYAGYRRRVPQLVPGLHWLH